MTDRSVMIMAGGTGGHIFPGLAVAKELRARHQPVIWLGTRRGLEARIVPAHGFEIEWVSIGGLRGKGVAAWVVTPLRVLSAVVQVLRAFRRCRPAVVLGMGGFVSGPGGIAAWLARKPLIIHEQNAVAGTTNRWLARFAHRIFSAFPGAFQPGIEVTVVGNPVRREITALAPPRKRHALRSSDPVHLLVVGGSQGAKILNDSLPQAIAAMEPTERPRVWHIAGRGRAEVESAYREAGVAARVDGFVDDMAEAYGWADVAIARAGALTISELEVAGVAAILIPYPYAIDDHQTKNAASFCALGAGVWIDQKELSVARLEAELASLIADRGKLLAMGEAARSQAKVSAAEQLADACVGFVEVAK